VTIRFQHVLAAVAIASLVTIAAAEDCLDQQFASGVDDEGPLVTSWEWAQTFTCEAGGELSKIEADFTWLGIPADVLTLELRTLVGEQPAEGAAALLASADVPLIAAPGTQTAVLDLTGLAITVETGERYALVLKAENPEYDIFNCAYWQGDGAGGYSGGRAFYRTPGFDWFAQGDADLVFRTYLDCATPVESVSWSALRSQF
jgi:hypothetical protein